MVYPRASRDCIAVAVCAVVLWSASVSVAAPAAGYVSTAISGDGINFWIDTNWGADWAVNSSGAVVGSGMDYDGWAYNAFVWTPAAGVTVLAPLDGAEGCFGRGINDAGMIVGYSGVETGDDGGEGGGLAQAATAWVGGAPVSLHQHLTLPPEMPGDASVYSRATAVNNAGDIVGVYGYSYSEDGGEGPYYDPDSGEWVFPDDDGEEGGEVNVSKAVMWRPNGAGGYDVIELGEGGVPTGVSDNGLYVSGAGSAVGWVDDAGAWSERTLHESGEALGVNSEGVFVGYIASFSDRRATAWPVDGVQKDIRGGYRDDAEILAINDDGDAVGYFDNYGGSMGDQALVWELQTNASGDVEYVQYDLDDYLSGGLVARRAVDIASDGTILIQDLNGDLHLLTPVPEPATCALLAVGGAGLMLRRRP